MAGTGNYQINFQTNVAPIERAMAGIAGNFESLMNRVRAIASSPVNVPVAVNVRSDRLGGINQVFQQVGQLDSTTAFGASGIKKSVQANLENQIRSAIAAIPAQAFGSIDPATGARTQASRAQIAAQKEALELASIAQLRRFIQAREIDEQTRRTASALVVKAESEKALAGNAEAVEAQRRLADQKARTAVGRKVLKDSIELAALQDAETREARDAVVTERFIQRQKDRELRARLARNEVLETGNRFERTALGGGFRGGVAAPIGRAGGIGGFFGGGLASTLRFGLPSLALFTAARGIGTIVREAEELEQIFVRLESQFQSLGQRGIFGGDDETQRSEAATRALGEYRERLFEIARSTGLATDETAELGQKFIGLFSSLEGSGAAQELAEQATDITAKFAIISGLKPEETFNDLAGSIRSFADTGREVLVLLDSVTDSIINVSDATGVSAREITDFVGRAGSAAAQAGIQLEEIISLAATALQGSGVGGAALAEQFNRILTGLQGELGLELSRLSKEFETTFAQIDVPDLGKNVAELFSTENIVGGNVREVLLGLIQGFDALTASQQRQIIASVGSRREGATLAAVLQNAATFTNALSAATDAAGEREDRFRLIIERLTGQFSRLRAEVAQFGLVLFDAGIRDVLAGLVSALSNFVDVLRLVAEVITPIVDLLRVALPDGFGGVATTIGLAVLATRLFSGALSALSAAGARVFGTLAIGEAQILRYKVATDAAAVSTARLDAINRNLARGIPTAGVGRFGRAFGGLSAILTRGNVALAAAAVGISLFAKGQRDAAEEARKTAERQQAIGEILRSDNDVFDRAATAAQAYADALKNVADNAAKVGGIDLEGDDPRAGRSLVTRSILSDISGRDRNSAEAIAALEEAFGGDLAALESAVQFFVGERAGFFQKVRSNLEFFGGEGFDPRSSTSGLGGEEPPGLFVGEGARLFPEGIPQEVVDLLAAVSTTSGDDPTVIAIDALNNFIQEQTEQRKSDAADALATLNDIVLDGQVLGLSSAEDVAAEIDRRAGPGGDRDLATVQLFEEVALELGIGVQDKAQEDIENLRKSFGLLSERFQAGFVLQSEFFAAAADEASFLRGLISDGVASGTDQGFQTALDAQKLLNELIDGVVKNIRDRADATIATQELIGRPLEGEDLTSLLIRLADNEFIRQSPEDFREVATDLVKAQQQTALNLIAEAETLEAAQAIVASFSLPPEISAIFTRSQVEGSEGVRELAAALGVVEADLPQFLDEFSEFLELGESANRIAIRLIQERIAGLRALLGSSQGVDPETLSQIRELEAQLGAFTDLNVITGADVGIDPDLSGKITEALRNQETLLDELARSQKLLAITGNDEGPAGLANQASELLRTLNDGRLVAGTEGAVETSFELVEIVTAMRQLQDEELTALEEALLAKEGITLQALEEAAVAGAIFQQINEEGNAFGEFVATYLTVGTTVMGGLLQEVATLVAGGKSAKEALREALDNFIRQLEEQLAAAQALFGSVRSLFDAVGIGRQVGETLQTLEEANALRDALDTGIEVPDVSIPRISVPSPSTGTGGGRNAKDAADALRELAEAQFELLRAQAGDDPVAQAVISGQEAQFALDNAKTEAERIRALAQQVEARREFWSAVNEVLQAENSLAIAIAEANGDRELALQLAVQGAQAQLEFLESQGAGLAQIAEAKIAVIEAEEAQQRGLIEAELSDLSFLFQIGELTTAGYIAALETILGTLDPIADEDLFRRITLQIKSLKNSANELQFNLPSSFDLPTLFEVRRLAQSSGEIGLTGAPVLGAQQSTTTASIVINVSTGLDWDEAREILGEALGTDVLVTSLETKRY